MPIKRIRITLTQLLTTSLIGLVVLLGLLFYLLIRTSQNSIMQASDNLRTVISREFAEKVTAYLNQLQVVEDNFQTEINHEVFNPKDPIALETFLFTSVITNSNLSEISFTYGEKIGYDSDGDILLAPTGRGEMSLFRRSIQDSASINTLYTYQNKGQWICKIRRRSPPDNLFGTPLTEVQNLQIVDPTSDLTFATPANKEYTGENIWSDLHWSQINKDLPDSQKKVEVSLQRTVADSKGNFLGVLRVGLFEKQIDMISHLKVNPKDPKDPHLVFITDTSGELITRFNDEDHLGVISGNLRYSSANAPPQVQLSLKDPTLNLVSEQDPLQSGQFTYKGETYLVTYREIEGSQDWILGILVPQSYYIGPLQAQQNKLLLITGIIIFCLTVGGFFVERSLKKEQKKIIDETLKMHNFDFKPSQPHSIFNDIYAILLSLELAKTAMRAMSIYVPIELVKRLFDSQKEPTLGGEIQEISILFTDIANFTSIAEKFPVNELATALGSYLKVMTQVIQNNKHGIIDKYIGDGIMALWNTPTTLIDHPSIACQAILDCSMALEELFTSTKWSGFPRFETRFGLHQDRVMVGHFGAPDRLNFTALGNGVNIASRLESLNKYYGTTMLVSESIYKAAKKEFVFRLLDFIAVKGETKGLYVYELIGKKGEKSEMNAIISIYEQALKLYQSRHFSEALNLLKGQLHDGPSHTLHTRCNDFLQNPPPASWDGMYIFNVK